MPDPIVSDGEESAFVPSAHSTAVGENGGVRSTPLSDENLEKFERSIENTVKDTLWVALNDLPLECRGIDNICEQLEELVENTVNKSLEKHFEKMEKSVEQLMLDNAIKMSTFTILKMEEIAKNVMQAQEKGDGKQMTSSESQTDSDLTAEIMSDLRSNISSKNSSDTNRVSFASDNDQARTEKNYKHRVHFCDEHTTDQVLSTNVEVLNGSNKSRYQSDCSSQMNDSSLYLSTKPPGPGISFGPGSPRERLEYQVDQTSLTGPGINTSGIGVSSKSMSCDHGLSNLDQNCSLRDQEERIAELEDQCSKLRAEIDGYRNVNLPTYDESVPWKYYCYQWERLAKLFGWTDEQLVDHFELSLRGIALSTYYDFFVEGLKPTFAEVKQTLNEALDMPESEQLIESRFMSLKQQPGESHREFGRRVCQMAPKAVSKNQVNSRSLKVFLDGCTDVQGAKLIRTALKVGPEKDNLRISEAVHAMEVYSGVEKDKDFESNEYRPSVRQIQVNKYPQVEKNASPVGPGLTKGPDNRKLRAKIYCCLCGADHSVLKCSFLRGIRRHCDCVGEPQFGTCFLCAQPDHWAYNCPRLSELREIVSENMPGSCETPEVEPKVKTVAKIHFCDNGENGDAMMIDIGVEKCPVRALYDTGASICVINAGLAHELNLEGQNKKVSNMILRTVSGDELPAKLVRDVDIDVEGQSLRWDIFVADVPGQDFIIGYDLIKYLQLTPRWRGKNLKR